MSIEEAMKEQISQQYNNIETRDPRVKPMPGVLARAAAHLEDLIKHEEGLQADLDRLRGSNVKHLDAPKEPAPVGLPGIFDQIERHMKTCAKLQADLNAML